MKKVLIIQQIIPEYRIAFFNLLKTELEKENIELSLIFGTNKGSDQELDWPDLIPHKKLKIGALELIWQPVTKFLRGKDLIIVEKSNKLLLNYYMVIVRGFWKNKLAFWGHGRNLQSNPGGIRNRFAALFLRRCDWWFAYTNSVKDFLIKNKYPANKITVVQNSIDTQNLRKQLSGVTDDEVAALRKEFGITGAKTAIFCGRMYPEKRIQFILDSCHIIKREIADFQMIFIGSGEDSEMVQKESSLHSWIHFVGPKNGSERIKYFKIADVQLMPGLVGLGILDSFALETPIVTTNYEFHSPEIEYLRNWENGVITENSLDDYSQTVIDILENKKYENLINGCKNSANKYTIENMVENFKRGVTCCLNQE